MKRGAIWIALTCLILTSLVLASCTTSTKTTPVTQTTTNTTSTATTTTTQKTTTVTTQTTATTTTATTGNWWDSLGKPQYGGTMTIRVKVNLVGWDPYFSASLTTIESAWMEKLTADNWATDPAAWDYKIAFRPSQYVAGQLAASWEFPDPGTYLLHLRQGIHWQNIPPANGREFTADDIVFHYDRMYGLGGGFTKPSPYQVSTAVIQTLTSVTATDKYTVAFKFTLPNPEAIMESMQAEGANTNDIECPEAVKLWGDVTDWHHAIGTGPFILTDYVSADSATLVKNPDYWGYDEHYPQNKLPYIDKLQYLIIPDDATALAAMRTGKIDILDAVTLQTAQAMKKTNPEILQITQRFSDAYTVDTRVDVKPFNDIRVREAMQMAIDLPTIASTYFQGTADPWPSTLTSNYMTGWGFPYSQWPQSLKDEYAYNPTAAKQLLSTAGYPNGFKTDCIANSASDLDLLQIVKSYFAAVGIDMTITTMDPATWGSYVQIGHKQDQLAYRGGIGGGLGHTFEPISQFNIIMAGFLANYWMIADPTFDALGQKALASTTVDGFKQAVADANKEVAQQHYIVSLLQPNLFCFCQPWLKGYNGQYAAISTSSGPHLNGFYMSRFWIDQNLKSSMGH